MVNLTTYITTDENSVINKTLKTASNGTGLLYNGANLLRPVIDIRAIDIDFNYVRIGQFNRYYFVDNYDVIEVDLIRLYLQIDVLKTYQSEILQATATQEASEDGDTYLSTRQSIYNLRPNFARLPFPQGQFDEVGSLVMVTIKGDN